MPPKKIRINAPAASRASGYTLVEVVMGATLFLLVVLGVLATILTAYRLALTARYQDRATNALASVADQFQNSPSHDKSTTPSTLKVLFASTGGAKLGTGMAWDVDRQCFIYPFASPPANVIVGDSTALTIPLNTLGQNDLPVVLRITREVRNVTDPTLTSPSPKAGTLVEGVFTGTYTLFGRQRELKFKVLRNLNPSDKT